jgi:DNA-binding transcriptional LysR family regulator
MNSLEPDFNQLKRLWILKTIIEAGGLSQAASKNKVTVSAISQALTTLEKSEGHKLLIRRNRTIQPTQRGLELLAKMEPVFHAFSQVSLDQKAKCSIPKMNWLNFGVSEQLAAEVVPPFISLMRSKLPNLKLKIRVGDCHELVKTVRRGDLCMALVNDVGHFSGLTKYPVAQDRLGLFKAKGLLDAGPNGKIPLALLKKLPSGSPIYYSRFLRAVSKLTENMVVCESTTILSAIVNAGAAAAILPCRVAAGLKTQLEEIPVEGTNRGYDILMVSEKNCDPVEDEFLRAELTRLLN